MDVRFDDHGHFHRMAARAALGGGLAAMLGPSGALAQAALAGGALAIAAWPCSVPGRRRRLLVGAACALAAAISAADLFNGWLLAGTGALLGLLLAAARDDAGRESGARPRSLAVIGLTTLACAGVALATGLILPGLAAVLRQLLPGWAADGAAGGAGAIWAVLATLPLHVAVGAEPVETRLQQLRPALTPELRVLAERAAAARRDAVGSLPSGARGDLRTLLDALALAALDVAERAAELGRAAPAGAEDELAGRVAQMEKKGESADDADTRGSYQRAAEALSGQLDHLRRVRRVKERALARLHEEVAHLERARFALSLLVGSDAERSALELELLHGRLEAAAAPFDEEPPAVREPVRISG